MGSRLGFAGTDEVLQRKLVVVGDDGVGKSALVFTYHSKRFPTNFQPVFDMTNSIYDVIVDDNTFVTVKTFVAPGL